MSIRSFEISKDSLRKLTFAPDTRMVKKFCHKYYELLIDMMCCLFIH